VPRKTSNGKGLFIQTLVPHKVGRQVLKVVKEEHRSLASYLRLLIMADLRARETIKRVSALVENPPEPSKQLKAAARRYLTRVRAGSNGKRTATDN
jgi:hypothetical protein